MIVTWSKGAADDNMPEDLLLAVFEKVRRHPWWQARARLAVAILQKESVLPPARVLEAGCGWGTNLEALAKAGARLIVHYGRAAAEADALVAGIRAAGGSADAAQADLSMPDGAVALAK